MSRKSSAFEQKYAFVTTLVVTLLLDASMDRMGQE